MDNKLKLFQGDSEQSCNDIKLIDVLFRCLCFRLHASVTSNAIKSLVCVLNKCLRTQYLAKVAEVNFNDLILVSTYFIKEDNNSFQFKI